MTAGGAAGGAASTPSAQPGPEGPRVPCTAGWAGGDTRLGHGTMRGPPAWPLRLLVRWGPVACAWTPAARAPGSSPQPTGLGPPQPWGGRSGLLAGAGAARSPRRWTSSCRGGGPGGGGGAGLTRLLGLWARPPSACGCWALAWPGAPRLPRAGLPGGPAVHARAGSEAWRRGPALPAAAAAPKDDSRLRPAALGRSEARKLLGLAYPERRRLAGTALPVLFLPLCQRGHLRSAWSRGHQEGTLRRLATPLGGTGGLPGDFYRESWTERSSHRIVEPFRLAADLLEDLFCLFP